jgi:hypothetical protein
MPAVLLEEGLEGRVGSQGSPQMIERLDQGQAGLELPDKTPAGRWDTNPKRNSFLHEWL